MDALRIQDLTEKEKSVLIATAMGDGWKTLDEVPEEIAKVFIVDWNRLFCFGDIWSSDPINLYVNMSLAHRVLHWAGKQLEYKLATWLKTESKRANEDGSVMQFAPEWWFIFFEDADGITRILDKILMLAIEAGLVPLEEA